MILSNVPQNWNFSKLWHIMKNCNFEVFTKLFHLGTLKTPHNTLTQFTTNCIILAKLGIFTFCLWNSEKLLRFYCWKQGFCYCHGWCMKSVWVSLGRLWSVLNVLSQTSQPKLKIWIFENCVIFEDYFKNEVHLMEPSKSRVCPNHY